MRREWADVGAGRLGRYQPAEFQAVPEPPVPALSVAPGVFQDELADHARFASHDEPPSHEELAFQDELAFLHEELACRSAAYLV